MSLEQLNIPYWYWIRKQNHWFYPAWNQTVLYTNVVRAVATVTMIVTASDQNSKHSHPSCTCSSLVILLLFLFPYLQINEISKTKETMLQSFQNPWCLTSWENIFVSKITDKSRWETSSISVKSCSFLFYFNCMCTYFTLLEALMQIGGHDHITKSAK